MSYTSPYQKTVKIHRSQLGKNFLGINNDSWKTAARILTPPSFMLYIYFASNKDGFSLALSPKAIQQEIGMARSTFYDQITVLESLGYLVKDDDKKSSSYVFADRGKMLFVGGQGLFGQALCLAGEKKIVKCFCKGHA